MWNQLVYFFEMQIDIEKWLNQLLLIWHKQRGWNKRYHRDCKFNTYNKILHKHNICSSSPSDEVIANDYGKNCRVRNSWKYLHLCTMLWTRLPSISWHCKLSTLTVSSYLDLCNRCMFYVILTLSLIYFYLFIIIVHYLNLLLY